MNVSLFFWFPAVGLLLFGCTPSPEEKLDKLSRLPDDMIQAIAAPESVWSCHCRDGGLPYIQEMAQILRDSKSLDSEAQYVASRDQIRPYLERASRCLRDEYLFEGEWTEFEAWSHRTFEQARDQIRLKTELNEVAHNKGWLPDQRLRRVKQIESGFRATNSVNGVVNALDLQAGIYHELRDDAAALGCLRRALAEREKAGRHTMTMAMITRIGDLFGKAQVDSMLMYFARSLEMSMESRDPMNTTRVLRHLGGYYQNLGQEAVAYELLMESVELCREFKGDNYEFSTILEALNHHTRLGAWNVVGDLLERGDRVVAHWHDRAIRNPFDKPMADRLSFEIGLFKARYLMATGHVEKGDELFRNLRPIARKLVDRETFAVLVYFWSSALLQCNAPEPAAKLAREGVAYADSTNLPLEARRLNLVLADASCRLGESQEAQKALDRFQSLAGADETANRRHWMIHDAVRVCIALAEGDTTRAEREAQAALARLGRFLKPLDQSVQACLFLDECRELREAVHRVLSANPEAGYGFEMAWRSLYGALGNGASSNGPTSIFTKTSGSLSQRCAHLGHGIQKQIANGDAVHSVYFVESQNVVRWTASKTGIVRERLSMSSEDLRGDVELVTRSFADPQTGPWSRDLTGALGRISALLPPMVQHMADSRPLFVSPDLYLANLPFEAIDPDPNGNYRPLIETCDVAYLRSAETGSVRGVPPTHGIVVASPQYPATLRRRYPSLQSLPYGEKESALVAATFPGTLSLQESHATKRSLSTHWESTSFIYVASHFIQSVETPYVSYLPLAASDSAALGDAMLDYGEIRKADLARCDLVVLSGCGTGAAYTNTQIAAPSLSDAFLDAGAKAVVHTRWRILDDEAYKFASDFIKSWALGESPIIALNDAKRAAWSRSGGQPSTTWAAYSISLSEIPSKPLRNGRSRS